MDVVVSSCLLAVVAMLVFNLYPTSFLSLRSARGRTVASNQACSLLEQYRVVPFQQLVPGKIWDGPQLQSDGVAFDSKISAQNVQGSDPTRLVQVEVEVSWSDSTGLHNVKYASYVSHLPR